MIETSPSPSGIAQRGEVAVVALEVGRASSRKPSRAGLDDALDRLGDHRRLHLGRRLRRADEGHAAGRAALEVVPLEARHEVGLPEDDVGDQPVRLLRCEQPAELVRRALRSKRDQTIAWKHESQNHWNG